MPGTLYVVATPIGNLEDLTFRALRTLKEVNLIAAEDTRRTSKLLAHYEVSKPLVSLHEHNEFREAPRLVDRMLAGDSVALVSDAGTPGISDPGTTLVRLARNAGLAVVSVPGPSAVTAALSVAGIPVESFVFLGFPPASGAARARWFQALASEVRTVVFFEAPHRIRRTLADAKYDLGIRPIIVVREITKINEELVVCTSTTTEEIMERGEFVVVVGRSDAGESTDSESLARSVELFGLITKECSLEESDALLAVCAVTKVNRSKLRNLVKKAAISAKRRSEAARDPSS